MLNAKLHLTSRSLGALDTVEDPELSQRLGLYQLFLRLYERHRGLLDEILSLEYSGAASSVGISPSFVQGLVLENNVYLITNLLRGKTQTLSQPQDTWTIGRDPRRVNLPIHDTRLSRCHAAIRYVNAGFQLVDLGSSNGSFINGEAIKQPTSLKDGDQVRLGSLSFTFFVCRAMQTLDTLSSELLAQVETAVPDVAPTSDRPKPKPALASNCSIYPSDSTMLFLRDKVK